MDSTLPKKPAVQLPPFEGGPPQRCAVFKRYKYVTMQFSAADHAPGQTFTLHQVEAKKLVDLLVKAIAEPVATSNDIFECSFVEGVYQGGPPELSQLVEFGAPGTARSSDTDHRPGVTSPAPAWELWRQDDNGNRFLVSAGHTRSEAEQLARHFEERGHKQMYWISPESAPNT